MQGDKHPLDGEILDLIGDGMSPNQLIAQLHETYEMPAIIEALQRALERQKIVLDSEGMVRAAHQLAEAA